MGTRAISGSEAIRFKKRVIAALESMPVERLAEIHDAERGTTVEDRLTFYLIFHESYHAGQLEILHELALAHK